MVSPLGAWAAAFGYGLMVISAWRFGGVGGGECTVSSEYKLDAFKLTFQLAFIGHRALLSTYISIDRVQEGGRN